MVQTRQVAAEAHTVNTASTAEQAIPAEVCLSGEDGFFRRYRWLVWLGAVVVVTTVSWNLPWLGGAVVVVAALSWSLMTYVDRVGREFFSKGQEVVVRLNSMARVLRSRDLAALAGFYAPDFQGSLLGLTNLRLVDDRDDIRIYALQSKDEIPNHQAARAEWQAYIEGFDSIEEVQLHLDRLEQWRGTDEVVARVRYELIGVPKGEPQAGIDRAYFRMQFDVSQQPCTIRSAELLEGDRVISARPLFVDVAAKAGINFTNQYYPAFLGQPLQFGMIRYGPAGITVVDYDNDGYYDLFIPDGVEAKLFRNKGDGTFEDVTAQAGLAA
jgi:hypothetical protein